MTENKQEESVIKNVLATIEEKHLEPRSRAFFATKESVLWLLWAVSVVVGAVALAIIFLVCLSSVHTLHELTHDNQVLFWLEAMPYLWLAVVGTMMWWAWLNFRHTKRGYRYSVWFTILSSMGGSVLVAIVLHVLGVGIVFDEELGRYTNLYTSQREREERRWQQPAEGRLLGMIHDATEEPIRLRDIRGDEWRLFTGELWPEDRDLVRSGRMVRVFGIERPEREFIACGLMPWGNEQRHTIAELAEIREKMIRRSRAVEFGTEEVAEWIQTDCATLPMLHRLRTAP